MTTDPALPTEADDDASALTDAELRDLLARAKAGNDEPLRRLVASYVTLRRLSADMIELIITQYGGATVAQAPLLVRVRELTRRHPG
jgi:hypothetical protein